MYDLYSASKHCFREDLTLKAKVKLMLKTHQSKRAIKSSGVVWKHGAIQVVWLSMETATAKSSEGTKQQKFIKLVLNKLLTLTEMVNDHDIRKNRE